eukprot:TRINITY_DN94576_c0_g1_i1.p1 TRINITY_DN94576_c0_g1~~TRINITY_DN94576_c0_g1_i1.p1  ORF type:complete len:578 (-),score=74.00 TRINITY_DN94576_c0_g1_i1:111-1775(-)
MDTSVAFTVGLLVMSSHAWLDRDHAVGHAASCLRFLRKAFCATPADQGKRRIEELRTSHFIASSRALCGIMCLSTALLLMAHPFRGPDYSAKVTTSVTIYTLSIIVTRPRAQRFMTVSHPWISSSVPSLILCILVVRICTVQDVESYHSLYAWRLFLRFSLHLAQLNHKVTAIWSAIICTTQAFKCTLMAPHETHEVKWLLVFVGQFWDFFGTWIFFYLVETWLVERMDAVVDAKNLGFEKLASSRLLTAFCDAEALLSNDLNIIKPAKKLSALLLSSSDLKGRYFPSFLTECDQQRFRAFIEESHRHEDHSPVNCLQVSLKDSYGMPLQCELFQVHIKDPVSGLSNHLLGISAVGEREEFPGASSNLQAEGTAHQNREGAQSSSSSSDSRNTLLHMVKSLSSEIEHVEVIIDSDPDLQVHELTIVLKEPDEASSCKPERALKHWVHPYVWPRFAGWVQDQTNKFYAAPGAYQAADSTFTDLPLRMPLISGKEVLLLAKQALLRVVVDQDDEDADGSLHLELLGMTVKRMSRSSGKSSGKILSSIEEKFPRGVE